MALAFVFPGQGSQAPGMGRDLAAAFPAAREVLVRYYQFLAKHDALYRGSRPVGEVLLLGKGHETYQVVGDQVIHFDDREEAEFALKKRYEKAS